MAAQQSTGAVFPCVAMKPLQQYQAYPIPVAAIYYDAAFNCRGEFTLQSVKELADSIAQAGRLICPVAVQPWTEGRGCEYRLIVGHRRFRAITEFLKWIEIPAYICEGLSEHEARMLNLVGEPATQEPEHLGRGPCNPEPLSQRGEGAARRPGIEAADQMGPRSACGCCGCRKRSSRRLPPACFRRQILKQLAGLGIG